LQPNICSDHWTMKKIIKFLTDSRANAPICYCALGHCDNEILVEIISRHLKV